MISASFKEVSGIADYLRNEIEVALIEQNATFLELSLESTVRQKAEDILNQLIFEYNKEAIEDKNQIALSTAEFINERLDIISTELDTVEVGLEEFKEANNLTNIEEEAKLFINKLIKYLSPNKNSYFLDPNLQNISFHKSIPKAKKMRIKSYKEFEKMVINNLRKKKMTRIKNSNSLCLKSDKVSKRIVSFFKKKNYLV